MRRLLPVWALLACAAVPARAEAPRVYSNDDLARVAPLAGEVGRFTVQEPAPAPGGKPTRAAEARGTSNEGAREARWRTRAARVRERASLLRGKASDLERKITARRRAPGVLPYSDPVVRELQERRDLLLAQVRAMEEDLEDAARREGALPGWLR